MNDDLPEDLDQEAPPRSERVFDISSDLKIKELKDEIATEPPPPALKIFSMVASKTPQPNGTGGAPARSSAPLPPRTTPLVPGIAAVVKLPVSVPPKPVVPTRPSINLLNNYQKPPALVAPQTPVVMKSTPNFTPLETGSNLPKSPSVMPPSIPVVPNTQIKPVVTPPIISKPVAPPVVPVVARQPIPAVPVVLKAPPAYTPPTTAPRNMQSELASIIPGVAPAAKTPIQPATVQPTGTPPRPQYTTSVNTEAPGTSSSIIKKLRTYEGDVAEVLSHRGTSALNMTIAENRRRLGEESIRNETKDKGSGTKSHSLQKILVLTLSLALIAGGLGGGYYLYQKSALGVAQQTPVVVAPKIVRPLVPSDSQVIVPIDGLDSSATLSRIGSEITKQQNQNSVKEVVIAKNYDGSQVRATVENLTSLFGVPVPDIILRTIAPQWMLGVYTDANGVNNTFVVVKTNLFQNAFAGMLKWESFMGLSLSKLDSDIEPRGQFKDEIVRNKDVRAYIGESGNSEFVYSFVDNSTLVVAQNDEAVAEVVSRLENSAFVR